jgi:hypothetical protein
MYFPGKTIPSLLLFLGLFNGPLSAQTLRSIDLEHIKATEDSLKSFSRNMVFNEEAAVRFRSDSFFVRGLVRALRIPHSFYYPFDSLNISRLYAPDSTFRIFTWQLKKDEYVVFQKGALQMRTSDGSLKLYPLFDCSMYTDKPEDSVRGRNNWIGALYYKIIKKQHEGKNFYTLLGFDDFSINANKKWLEVLTFRDNGEPQFGGPFISFEDDSLKKPMQYRYSIQYKKEAKALFNYSEELGMIILDHFVSESNEPENKSTLIPDGDYEAFQWKNGRWVHIDKLFNQSLLDGAFPREQPLYDDAGNIDESKLEEISRKNEARETPKKPIPAEMPKKKSVAPKPVKQ